MAAFTTEGLLREDNDDTDQTTNNFMVKVNLIDITDADSSFSLPSFILPHGDLQDHGQEALLAEIVSVSKGSKTPFDYYYNADLRFSSKKPCELALGTAGQFKLLSVKISQAAEWLQALSSASSITERGQAAAKNPEAGSNWNVSHQRGSVVGGEIVISLKKS